MKQITLSVVMRHEQDHQLTRLSQYQYGLTKDRSCLMNLISICNKVTHLVDEGRAVDVVYFDLV